MGHGGVLFTFFFSSSCRSALGAGVLHGHGLLPVLFRGIRGLPVPEPVSGASRFLRGPLKMGAARQARVWGWQIASFSVL